MISSPISNLYFLLGEAPLSGCPTSGRSPRRAWRSSRSSGRCGSVRIFSLITIPTYYERERVYHWIYLSLICFLLPWETIDMIGHHKQYLYVEYVTYCSHLLTTVNGSVNVLIYFVKRRSRASTQREFILVQWEVFSIKCYTKLCFCSILLHISIVNVKITLTQSQYCEHQNYTYSESVLREI